MTNADETIQDALIEEVQSKIAKVKDVQTIMSTWRKPEEILVIRNTVWSEAMNEYELAMFLQVAKNYELDPIQKEICLIKFKGKNQIITTRDWFLKIANRNPEFQWINSMEVRQNDDWWWYDYSTHIVDHQYKLNKAERWDIVGAWCVCKRNGRDPVFVFVDIDEYDKKQFTWNSHKSAMIRKVAESIALKKQFSITWLRADVEMEKVATESPKDVTLEEMQALTEDFSSWNESDE